MAKTAEEWNKLTQDKMYSRSLGIAWDNSYREMTGNDAAPLYRGAERQMLIETILEAKACA